MKPNVLLALGLEKASRSALVVAEEMVDKVGRKGDQVSEKDAGCQTADYYPSPGPVKPSEGAAEHKIILANFL